MPAVVESRQRFRRITTAGVFFQGGAAAVDTSTIVAALVHGLTGSTMAVGAAAAISRYGWLFPQLIVGWLAQRQTRRLGYYKLGAFGRTLCLAGVALLVALAGDAPGPLTITAFFLLWTAYAFVGGIVAVPYNDIVARSIASKQRSRMLALRFFGGGLLAIGVAVAAGRLLEALSFSAGYAAVLLLGAVLLLISTLSFVSAGESPAPAPQRVGGFIEFLHEGLRVWRIDRRFRLFLYSRWAAGLVAMAWPFYILQVMAAQGAGAQVAFLLGAQTLGALLSNPLWGWWGDARGKRSLLEGVALISLVPPLLTLLWLATDRSMAIVPWFTVVFVGLGAVGNGGTIAQLGYLMEISPDARRPAYSGYFNAMAAPAALLPLAGAALADMLSYAAVFAASAAAAVLQCFLVRQLRTVAIEEGDS